MEVNTPRTDEFEQRMYAEDCCLITEPEFPQMLEFARQLERETIALAALTVCGCGDYFTAHDPGTCGNCCAAIRSAEFSSREATELREENERLKAHIASASTGSDNSSVSSDAVAAGQIAPTRIWFDTEFIEDGRTIDLISIGLVREDGVTYYAECEECDTRRASDWVKQNVLPHLRGPLKARAVIAEEIREFAGEKPEFWAYYADYDWVALCQLYGTMMDLPKGWPMYCRDIKQLCDSLGNPPLPKQGKGEHHALADAFWNRGTWAVLRAMEIAPEVKP